MKPEQIKERTEKLVELPTLPGIVAQLIGLIESPDSTAADIEKILTNDPALGAKVLKLVNSAFYGMTKKVGSIKQAIVILGFSTIRSLAISASVIDLFKERRMSAFHMKDFWVHSIGTACCCNVIAEKSKKDHCELYFVCGLLHDIGKIALSVLAERDFAKILRKAEKKQIKFADAEYEVFEQNLHESASGWLAEAWKLPPRIAAGVAAHHRVEKEDGCSDYSAAVSVSNYLCHKYNMGHSGDFSTPVLSDRAMAYFPETDIHAVEEKFVADLEKTSGLADILA